MGWSHVLGAPRLGVSLRIQSETQNPIHECSPLGFGKTRVVHDGLCQRVLARDVVPVARMELLDEATMWQAVRLGQVGR